MISPHEDVEVGHEWMSDQELIEAWGAADETVAMAYHGKQVLELELRRRMRDREATVIEHPMLEKCAIEPANTYDQSGLDDLRGLLDEGELPQYYEPPTSVPVPRKWKVNKVKGLKKRGGEIKRVIEAALIPDEKLTIKRRK